jgi:hypothetical protein
MFQSQVASERLTILRDEEQARWKSLTEHGQRISSIAERIAVASLFFGFGVARTKRASCVRALCAKPDYFCEYGLLLRVYPGSKSR